MSDADDLAQEFQRRALREEMAGNVSKARSWRKIAADLESLDPMYEQPKGRVPSRVIADARLRLLKDDMAAKRSRAKLSPKMRKYLGG